MHPCQQVTMNPIPSDFSNGTYGDWWYGFTQRWACNRNIKDVATCKQSMYTYLAPCSSYATFVGHIMEYMQKDSLCFWESRFFLTSIWLFIKFSCALCSEFSRSLVIVPEPMAPCALKGRGAKPSLVLCNCSSWSFCDWLELLASNCGVLDADCGGPDLISWMWHT